MLSTAAFSDSMIRARTLAGRFTRLLYTYPLLSVILTVVSFSFFGPLAALVLVATMLDHEFAHRYMMHRFGYQPGPVRLMPFVGAHVRAGKPMLRSADIVLIYLAGPLAGILSAACTALLASRALPPSLAHPICLGAAVSIALNLFNLIPVEPLDGGLIARVLPYPALLLFPGAIAVWLWHNDASSAKLEALVLAGVTLIIGRKVHLWHRYVMGLRAREQTGDRAATDELQAAFIVPLLERIVVVSAYVLLVPIAVGLLEVLSKNNAWFP